jgi:hypothetical protein
MPPVSGQTQTPPKSREERFTIALLILSGIASVSGAILAVPSSPDSWLDAILTLLLIAEFGIVIPIGVAWLIVRTVAKRRGSAFPALAFFLPASLYIPLHGYFAYIIAQSDHYQDQDPASVAGLAALGIMFVGPLILAGVAVICLVSGLIAAFVSKPSLERMSAYTKTPPQPPAQR